LFFHLTCFHTGVSCVNRLTFMVSGWKGSALWPALLIR
jgi:hypothetical protein